MHSKFTVVGMGSFEIVGLDNWRMEHYEEYGVMIL